jgi:hypothetical protein
VLDIIRACAKAQGTPAWSEEDFRIKARPRNCIPMVVEGNEGIVGYMLYEVSNLWC